MPLALLGDRCVVRVAGERAREFLHSLVTNDVMSLNEGEARFAALLSPQGKILADFLIYAKSIGARQDYLIDCPRLQTDDFVKRLRIYRLRAEIDIERRDEFDVIGFWGEPKTVPSGFSFVDSRMPEIGGRILAQGWPSRPDASAQAYEAHRIDLIVPRGGVDFLYGEAYPHEARMDALNGLDFHKGCYVGQEVVSRMQHRGALRTRLVKARIEGPAPAPFAEIRAGDTLIGKMGSSAKSVGLAMLRLDRLAEALAGGAKILCQQAVLSHFDEA